MDSNHAFISSGILSAGFDYFLKAYDYLFQKFYDIARIFVASIEFIIFVQLLKIILLSSLNWLQCWRYWNVSEVEATEAARQKQELK